MPGRSAIRFQAVRTQQSVSAIWNLRNVTHLLLCLVQAAAVSWALLTPDPFLLVRGTSLSWVQSVGDIVQHTFVFTVLSATVFSLCIVVFGEIPPGAVFAMLAYCLCVEGLQAFAPGRSCSAHDAIANITGFVLGFGFARLVAILRPTLSRA